MRTKLAIAMPATPSSRPAPDHVREVPLPDSRIAALRFTDPQPANVRPSAARAHAPARQAILAKQS